MNDSDLKVTLELDVGTTSVVLSMLMESPAADVPNPRLYSGAWHVKQAIETIKEAMLAWPADS